MPKNTLLRAAESLRFYDEQVTQLLNAVEKFRFAVTLAHNSAVEHHAAIDTQAISSALCDFSLAYDPLRRTL